MRFRHIEGFLVLLLMAAGCSGSGYEAKDSSILYHRLGGNRGIYTVVNDFVDRVGQDNRINSYFQGVDLDHFKTLLTEQICQVAGGPCVYTGRDMKRAHQGLGVTNEAFDALVQDLIESMKKFQVSYDDQNVVLAVLAPMRPDIVEGNGGAVSLYSKLGKTKGIYAVVSDFVDIVGGDKRINGFFKNVDLDHLKELLTDQICQAAGGPCVYAGRDMKKAHQGMGVSNAAFDALVQDLAVSMNKHQVGQEEQNTLLSVLGSMRKDIVEK